MKTNEISCGELMKRICDLLGARANNSLKELDITFQQMKMLTVIDEREDGSITLKELERIFDVSQATAAGIVKRMEKKGYVEGYMSPDDRRIKHIRLAERGVKLCRCAACEMEEGEGQFVRALDREERAELKRLLTKIYACVRGEENDG